MTISRRTLLLGTSAAAALAACSAATRRVAGPAVSSTTASTGTPQESIPGPPGRGESVGGPARLVRSGPANSRSVALTFHGAGDVVLVNQLLEVAHRLRAPITVFAVGTWLNANPSMAGKILSAGNELANHTYTHPALGQLGRAAVASEITRCRDLLMAQAGTAGRWFRPSGIEVATPLMAEEAGRAGYRTVVGYDVDPHDYQDPGGPAVVSRVRAGLHPGAIVSLHTGHAGTVAALEPIVTAVRAAGLEPVLVRDLLGVSG